MRLSGRDEIEAIARAKAGDAAAREQLVRQYEPLAKRIAGRYARQNVDDFEDIVQGARLGICRAIELFDESYGASFMTYVRNWIRSYACKCADKGHLVKRAYRATAKKQQRDRAALGDYDGTKLDKRRAKLDEAISRNLPISSLDEPIYRYDDKSDVTPLDRLEDESESPEDSLLARERLEVLREMLCGMDARTVDILLRGEKSLNECGMEHGVTRERIRQIEIAGIAELRKRYAREAAQ